MRAVLIAATLLAGSIQVAGAQVPPPPPQRQPSPRDTVKVPPFRIEPPVPPLGAMLRSLLLPGWGQSMLGRRATGAAFIFLEGITVTMTLKSIHQLHYQEDVEAETVNEKKQEVQDWAVLWGFNHLLAAAEAFVAAQLWDFPTELEARTLPSGATAVGVRVYWR